MANSAHFSDHRVLEATWQAIERQLDELSQLARSNCSQIAFYDALSRQLTLLTGDSRCEVWILGSDGWCQHEHPDTPTAKAGLAIPQLWIATLEANERPVCLRESTKDCGPTIVGPIQAAGQTVGLLAVRLGVSESAETVENQLEIVAALCDISGSFEERRSINDARLRGELWRGIEAFALAAHRQLDQTATCFAISNEARRLLTCDRVSVIVRRRGRCKLQAISGVDHFDRRSGEVVQLERLAEVVARTGDPQWYDGDATEIPPSIEAALNDFMDHATSRNVAVIPLLPDPTSPSAELDPSRHRANECDFVLVLERFDGGGFDEQFKLLASVIARQSESALRNARQYSRIPLPLRSLVGSLGYLPAGRWAAATVTTVFLGAAVAALFLVETDFQIHCRGDFRPSLQRDVFAPAAGSVEQLFVAEGDTVGEGDPLVRLSSTELEYELGRINGELQTHRSELRSVQTSLRTSNHLEESRQDLIIQRTAEEAKLKNGIATLEEQLRLLRARSSELNVASPLTGTVMTADLTRRLTARPVGQGQRLLTIAAVEGGWQLDLKILDQDIGHVQAALQGRPGNTAPVTYMFTTDPSSKYVSGLAELGIATEVDDVVGPYVRGTVPVARAEHGSPRSGATVIARIDCGRRSLGFVWFRGAWELLRTRFFW